jgi:hypothetical protein
MFEILLLTLQKNIQFTSSEFCSCQRSGRRIGYRFKDSEAHPGGVAQWTSHPPQEQKARV